MATYNNLGSLFAAIKGAAREALQNEVYEKVKSVEENHISSDVYGAYSPTMYERRGAGGGLLADENIIGEMVSDDTLSVRNTASPSPSVLGTAYSPSSDTTFAGWIENGEVNNIFNGTDAPWTEPRPFTQNTVEELQQTKEHVQALKAGLRARGISCK